MILTCMYIATELTTRNSTCATSVFNKIELLWKSTRPLEKMQLKTVYKRVSWRGNYFGKWKARWQTHHGCNIYSSNENRLIDGTNKIMYLFLLLSEHNRQVNDPTTVACWAIQPFLCHFNKDARLSFHE
jgi:hypothetical protein